MRISSTGARATVVGAAAAALLGLASAVAPVSALASTPVAGSHVVVAAKTAHKTVAHKTTKHKAAKHNAPVVRKPAAAPLTPFEARLVYLINQARAQNGLKALLPTAGTTDVARTWSVQMAQAGTISHNPALVNDVQSSGSFTWTFIAENVGTGPADNPDALFAAYMASPHHRANILDPRGAYVGMGTIEVSGPNGNVEYNTTDFTDEYSSAYGAEKTALQPSVQDPASVTS